MTMSPNWNFANPRPRDWVDGGRSAGKSETGSALETEGPGRRWNSVGAIRAGRAPWSRRAKGGGVQGALLISCVLASLAVASDLQARELWADEAGDRYIALNSSLKSVLLMSEATFPQSGAVATSFERLRFDLTTVPAPWLETELAYEQRAVVETDESVVGGGTALLPPTGQLPYQVIRLGDTIIDDEGLLYEHAFDRLAIAWRGEQGTLKVGRQAIGVGRANFFTALDLLSPFGTFQVDQEWKAGVDAIDAQWQVADTASVGLSAAAENSFGDVAILARAQGYWGDVDAVLMGGKRSEDWMAGVALSTQLLDAAFQGEFAYFATDGNGLDRAQIGERGVLKAVGGGSYSFQVLGGLTWVLEYHFNGFGVTDLRDDPTALVDPDWIKRLQRGDSQTIGVHELASSLSLTVDENVTAMTYAVASPVDGSGLWSLGGTWSYSDNLSLDLNGFVPWGASPSNAGPVVRPRSEYGASPASVYLSMRFYD